jgi:hypothetical protein
MLPLSVSQFPQCHGTPTAQEKGSCTVSFRFHPPVHLPKQCITQQRIGTKRKMDVVKS